MYTSDCKGETRQEAVPRVPQFPLEREEGREYVDIPQCIPASNYISKKV